MASNGEVANKDTTSVGDIVQFVRSYALQETVGPLKGAGRWIGAGIVGALLMSIGLMMLLLGVLRLLQTEVFRSDGWTSIFPYLIVTLLCAGCAAAAATRMKKTYLYKEDRP